MGAFRDAWDGVRHYFSATKNELAHEWDEFQEEIDKTASYDQSTGSDVVQQSFNGVSFVAESVGSLVNNDASREMASHTIEEIKASPLYQDIVNDADRASHYISHKIEGYLEENPLLKAQLHEIGEGIEAQIDRGVDYAKEVAKAHPEALRNIGAIGGIAAAVVPVAKGAKLLSSGEKSLLNSYVLSEAENKAVFDTKILPELQNKFDFTAQEQPTLFFTGGLPGAGKSKIVDEIQEKYDKPNIIIADPDAFRKEHPAIKIIQKEFGHNASIITHPDASRWAKRTLDEAMTQKADIIKDGTLNSATNLEKLLEKASANGYKAEIQIKAVNEYESLEGVFGRYANQYASKPHEARFVPPSYVKESKVKIEQTAQKIQEMDVHAFKVIDRDGNTIYDQALHKEDSAQQMMQEATDLKNYSKEQQGLLQEKWQSTIHRLKEVNAPAHIQRSAKEIHHEFNKELHPISARVMTKENAIIAGGVGTYMATDALGQMSLEELEQAQSHETQTSSYTPKGRTILNANNTTHADDIIRADENTQTQSCSLLPPEMRYDNRQIAEFDIDEDENNFTDDELYNEFMDSHGYNIPFPDNKQSQETQADTLTKEQKTLQDLYPHLYQDKSDEDELDDQNDMGMEM